MRHADKIKRQGIHAAKIGTSERLQKVLAILEDGKWHGSFELMNQTKLVAIGSAISELRANGCKVESRCLGQGRYEYRLGERVEEGVSGANEGRFTLAESSPRFVGKGESEIMLDDIESGRKENDTYERPKNKESTVSSDSPAPPKWNDWEHIKKTEEQGRMF